MYEFTMGIESAVKWNSAIAGGMAVGMDNLAKHLSSTASIINDSSVTGGIRTHVTRDSRVGINSGYGPSAAVQELNEALYDLLDNMAGDWHLGAENIRTATRYFEAAENGNVGEIGQLQAELDEAADAVLGGTGIEVHSYRKASWWAEMGGH